MSSISRSVLFIFFIPLLLSSCRYHNIENNPYGLEIISNIDVYNTSVKENAEKEFVDIEKFIPNIVLDIKYASTDNFTNQKIYPIAKAFIRKPVLDALINVQKELNSHGLGLKIFDAYRPYSATLKFYNIYQDTVFVAAPWNGSRHNRGCSIDVTLINLKTKEELEMPTRFDDFTERSSHNFMDLPNNVIQNRKLLYDVMKKNGFEPYINEWWHYDYKEWENFELMDLSLEILIDLTNESKVYPISTSKN